MFWRSLRDEALGIARDSGALLIMVLGVLAYGVIYPIPYERAVVRDVPVVVVDEDGTALSRQLARMVDAHAATRVAATVPDRAEAEREIAAGRATGALVVPHDFERNVLRGAHAEVLAICDATVFLVYKTAFTGIAESTGTLSAGVEIRRLEAHGVPGWDAQRMRAPGTRRGPAAVQPDGELHRLRGAGGVRAHPAPDAAHRDRAVAGHEA